VTPTATPVVATQYLYGVSQSASFAISNASRSVCPSSCGFDDSAASITGTFADDPTNVWEWTAIQDTTLTTILNATIEVRFRHSNWNNDTFVLEYSADDWTTDHVLATYTSGSAPPGSLTTVTFAGLESVIDTPALANAVRLRFRGVSRGGSSYDNMTLRVDQVRLVVRGWP
jgi:hypothetical protein